MCNVEKENYETFFPHNQKSMLDLRCLLHTSEVLSHSQDFHFEQHFNINGVCSEFSSTANKAILSVQSISWRTSLRSTASADFVASKTFSFGSCEYTLKFDLFVLLRGKRLKFDLFVLLRRKQERSFSAIVRISCSFRNKFLQFLCQYYLQRLSYYDKKDALLWPKTLGMKLPWERGSESRNAC